MRRRAAVIIRERLTPYAIPFVIVLLVILAAVAVVGVLLKPADAVVLEVVPIDDDEQVQVQLAGAVATPGVYALPPGSTLEEALALAGGALAGADTASLDLSAELRDGQFTLIPTADVAAAAPVEPLDANAATAAEFETLPGIGPVIAARIVAYREALGGFSSVDQLSEVSGISDRMVEELRPFVVVETP